MTRSKFPFWMKNFDDWYDADGGAVIMTARYDIQREIGKGQWKYWPETTYGIPWWNLYEDRALLIEETNNLLRDSKWTQ